MNIRKKLAVAAAVALPASGLIVLGGVSPFVSAGGPPVLQCSSLGNDPANATGGVTFDDTADTSIPVNTSTGSGTVGLALDAGLSPDPSVGGPTGPVDESALPVGVAGVPQVMVITAQAIAGQQILLGDGITVTVISDSNKLLGLPSAKNFETAQVTPNVGVGATALAKKAAITIEPTVTPVTPYSTFSGTVSNGSATVTTSTPEFDTTHTYNPATGAFPLAQGSPVSVFYYDTTDTEYVSPFSLPEDHTPTSPVLVAAEILSVTDSTHAVIGQFQLPTGSTAVAPSAITSETSGSVVVTAGMTNTATAPAVATDYDLAFTGCASSLHADVGVIDRTT